MKTSAKRTKILILVMALLFSASGFSQSRWYPYLGLHIAGDAELYYVGPSFQLGTDFRIKNNFFISGYLLYFPRNVDRTNSDGTFEKGNYRSTTATLLMEARLGKKTNKKTFVGIGIAFQKSKDDFVSSWNELHNKRKIFIPAIRMGHIFFVWKRNLSIELNATGPCSYQLQENGFTSDVLEVLTQVSLGTR